MNTHESRISAVLSLYLLLLALCFGWGVTHQGTEVAILVWWLNRATAIAHAVAAVLAFLAYARDRRTLGGALASLCVGSAAAALASGNTWQDGFGEDGDGITHVVAGVCFVLAAALCWLSASTQAASRPRVDEVVSR